MLILHNSISYPELENITVYRDDAMRHKFYAFPAAPRIRLNKNDRPVFLLTKYAFSDQDREENDDLPVGGGFVNLDVVYALTSEQGVEVQTRLQNLVEDEWARRRGLDRTSDDFQYKGPDAELGTPQWVDGAVRFHVIDDANLIKGKMSEGKPSMLGPNNAIFNATLTPAGATFFERTLTDPDGTGIDLTPIQVEYDLTFKRRLPPARIRVYGSVREVYTAISELDHDYDSHFWSEDDFTTNESYSESLYRSEVVSISIDTGEYAADSDEIEELRSFALGQLTSWLQDNLFERLTKFDPSYPDMEDVYSKEEDVYRMKKIEQVVNSRLYIDIKQTGIVDQTIHPQATLESFFGDLTKEQIAEHVRVVDLEDDFFKTLALEVNAFADYTEIAFVKVDVEYETDEGLKTNSFAFENADAGAQLWNPRLFSGSRDYRWRYEVGYKSDPGDIVVTDWQDSRSRQLMVNVGSPGKLDIDILAGQVDWQNLIEQVQVTMSYEDSRNDVEKEEETFILTSDIPSTNYQRWIYKKQEQPLKWSAKYFLKNGQEVELTNQEADGSQIIINDTFVDILDVIVVPSGHISAINQVIVDLRYKDQSGYSNITHVSISQDNFFFSWKVPLKDKTQKDWEWKQLVLYKDGTHSETSWKKMTGDQSGSQTLLIHWDSPPTIEITVNPALLKFDAAPVIEVNLTYKGETIEGESPMTFVFEEKKKQKWVMRVEDESVKEYDYEITYYVDPVAVTKTGTSDRKNFIVPKLIQIS